ncbi:uncharacterized protein SCHCODRAFT_02665712 [Schizophyllum commune H4-8]|uniref:uncharacterized protein n=1 Tax=Schizophyllum commune (strain H4-8 / FGSC 9210) TaxID=578458 RepID=UPI00215FD166|nr:uncharacterized protein SCHCODRAFT_02665712 [Schizophyllum commune H4-8]KAI5895353.1 hypothetical protein SCHCODRAFT_02665712 [Schizophyllum commune H4-8]
MRLALPSAKRARKKRTRNRIFSGISRRQQLPRRRAVSVALFLREFASVGGGESWSGGRAACGMGREGQGKIGIFRKGSEARPSRGGSTLS